MDLGFRVPGWNLSNSGRDELETQAPSHMLGTLALRCAFHLSSLWAELDETALAEGSGTNLLLY